MSRVWFDVVITLNLLVQVVGESGKVIAHANTPILSFAGEEHANRHADNRLPNTDHMVYTLYRTRS